MATAARDVRMVELEAGLSSARGRTRRAEHLGRELADHDPEREGRHREDGRAVQGIAHRSRHLAVGHRVGRRDVDRAGEVRPEQVLKGADLVVERHEAPVLVAFAEPPTEAEPEQWQQASPRAASARHHQPAARVHYAYTGLARLVSGRLPGLDDLGEEAASAWRGLVDRPRAGVAVEADSRRGDEDRRLRIEHRDGMRDGLGAADPALPDLALVGIGPALVADADAGQMDHAVDPGQPIEVDRAATGVPLGLVGSDGAAADEPEHLVALAAKGGYERGADEAGGAGDGDLHGSIVTRDPVRGDPTGRRCWPRAARSEAEVALEGAFLEPVLDRDEEPRGVRAVDQAGGRRSGRSRPSSGSRCRRCPWWRR